MAAGTGPGMTVLALAVLLAGCADRDNPAGLMNLRPQHEGPDEFAIMPTKPLEMPQDFSALPTPVPGAANLVDRNPRDEAVIALGGRPGAGSTDGALVAAAGRHGTSAGIREELAADDAAFRARQRPKLLERLFGRSSYHSAYGRDTTAPDAELDLWRRAGARTPAVPPVSDR